jgi:hypothetical protein
VQRISDLKQSLINHQLFDDLTSIESLRIFMEHHVACVWDFMQLLKNLQGHFCPSGTGWSPPSCSLAARLINDIVLYEESDQDSNNSYCSHFEMYKRAMLQIGANTRPIELLCKDIQDGVDVGHALNTTLLPRAALQFSQNTLNGLNRPVHEQIGIFLHSRESVIPDLFIRLVESIDTKQTSCSEFIYYLKRHIFIDAVHHGPMAERLLEIVCQNDSDMHSKALEAAYQALLARQKLWDAISLQVRSLASNCAIERQGPLLESSGL